MKLYKVLQSFKKEIVDSHDNVHSIELMRNDLAWLIDNLKYLDLYGFIFDEKLVQIFDDVRNLEPMLDHASQIKFFPPTVIELRDLLIGARQLK